ITGGFRDHRVTARRHTHRPGPAPTQGNGNQHDRTEESHRPGLPRRSASMSTSHGMTLTQGAAASRIVGFGSTQPDHVVTNDDLAKVMDTNDQWIQERVGIVERRFAAKDEMLVDMAVQAGKNALADAGNAPSEIDTLILPNCTMPTQ